MIIIKITNARQISENEKGWLLSKVAHHFTDIQLKVEEEIASEIQKAFSARNIEAVISVVKDD